MPKKMRQREVTQMKVAYLLIDYVYDFIDDGGVLSLGERGQKLKKVIEHYILSMRDEDWLIECTDCHDSQTFEHSLEANSFPLHCATDEGRALYINKELINKDQYFKIQKSSYSAFSGTALNRFLIQKEITHLVLFGVCSEVCVLHTAIDAYNLGYNISVVEQGCAGLGDAGHQFALDHMKNVLGATML